MPVRFTHPFAAILIFVALVSSADAQPATSLADLARHVEQGERVRIVRADGTHVKGDLGAIGPAAVEVDVDGQMVRVGAADVREIGVRDGVRKGILIGLGAGLAAGLIAGARMASDAGNLAGLAVMRGTAIGGGVGVGLGAAIGAAIPHYRTVYGAPPTVRVSPVVAPGQGYGAVVAIGW